MKHLFKQLALYTVWIATFSFIGILLALGV